MADTDGTENDVTIRGLETADWPTVRRIYAEGIATGEATFETEVPDAVALDARWLPRHRWIAVVGDRVLGWASATAASGRACYSGVVETSVYVGADARGHGVGRSLLGQQTGAADADEALWTLQTSIFPENAASIGAHHAAGFRVVGVREAIGRLGGRWRDTVLMERRCAAPR